MIVESRSPSRLLVADLPRVGAELVDRQVLDPRRLLRPHVEHGHDECADAVGRHEPLDDGDLAVGSGVDHEPREHRRAVCGDGVRDGDRAVDDGALRDREHHRRHERGVQLGEGVGRVTGEQIEPAGRELRADALGAGDDRVDGSRPETFEVELADAAVAPDLLLGGGQLGGREPLGRGEPLLENGADQIWIEDADRVGGERRHGLNSTIRVVVIATAARLGHRDDQAMWPNDACQGRYGG